MTNNKAVEPSPWSISIARNAAIGHNNAGFMLFEQLEELMLSARESGEPLDLSQVFELEIPAVTNLALGIELLFKVHYFQSFLKYPTGHDVRALSDQLPEEKIVELRRIYAELYNQPGISKGPEIRYSSGRVEEAKEWEKTDFSTYDLAVNYVGSLYVKWRYIYEHFGDSFDVHIAFGPFYFLSQTLHMAIEEFIGTLKVHIAKGPVIWHAP